jgi:hypothetical protein
MEGTGRIVKEFMNVCVFLNTVQVLECSIQT